VVGERAQQPHFMLRGRDLHDGRMLASARAEKKDVHARSAGALVFGGWCSMARLLRKGSPPATGNRVHRLTRGGAKSQRAVFYGPSIGARTASTARLSRVEETPSWISNRWAPCPRAARLRTISPARCGMTH